jgi:hypothetical protein
MQEKQLKEIISKYKDSRGELVDCLSSEDAKIRSTHLFSLLKRAFLGLEEMTPGRTANYARFAGNLLDNADFQLKNGRLEEASELIKDVANSLQALHDLEITMLQGYAPDTKPETRPIPLYELKQFIAASPDFLPRTDKLEKQIKIGVGYHKKWYRSQREHWLGWIVAKELECELKWEEPSALIAKRTWTCLNCMPMMFWLAEAAQVDNVILDRAERTAIAAASTTPHDCPPHGKAIREAISWHEIETSLSTKGSPRAQSTRADVMADTAFENLANKLPKYRKLKDSISDLIDQL